MATDLIALLTGGLSAAAALGGVYLSNFMKRRDEKESRSDARQVANLETKRQRGEQLYISFDAMRAILQRTFDSDMKFLNDQMDISGYEKRKIDLEKDLKDQLYIAKFNIETFFPRVLSDYNKWREVTKKAFAHHDKLISDKFESGVVDREAIDDYRKHASECLNRLTSICSQVAEACRS